MSGASVLEINDDMSGPLTPTRITRSRSEWHPPILTLLIGGIGRPSSAEQLNSAPVKVARESTQNHVKTTPIFQPNVAQALLSIPPSTTRRIPVDPGWAQHLYVNPVTGENTSHTTKVSRMSFAFRCQHAQEFQALENLNQQNGSSSNVPNP